MSHEAKEPAADQQGASPPYAGGRPADTVPADPPGPTRPFKPPAGTPPPSQPADEHRSAPSLPPRYQIDRPIGGGGEADVYACHDTERNRESVVVKRYRPNVWPDKQVLQKLRQAPHPHLVPVIDFGTYGGAFYEVIGLMTGGTLAGRTLPVAVLESTVLPQIVGAIQHCHGHPSS